MSENRIRYFTNSPAYLQHAQSAYEQRKNYDAQKRHERYLRDRDAGKTGYIGRTARTQNPYGNYASLYYDPEKAREYYLANRKLSNVPKQERERKPKEAEEVVEEVPEETPATSGGGGGAGGGGGGAASPNNDAAERAAEAQRRAEERQDRQERKADLRQEANDRITELKENLATDIQNLQDEISEANEEAAQDKSNEQEKVAYKMEQEQADAENRIYDEQEKLKKEIQAKRDPIKEKNAEIRGKLDSMGENTNPQLRARLQKQLAKNTDNMMQLSADYTEGISDISTKHTRTMRTNINKLRQDLFKFIESTNTKRKTTVTGLRSKIRKLRDDNRKEIKAIRDKLRQDLEAVSLSGKNNTNSAKAEFLVSNISNNNAKNAVFKKASNVIRNR